MKDSEPMHPAGGTAVLLAEIRNRASPGRIITRPAGCELLRENSQNNTLHLILEGVVELRKAAGGSEEIAVDRLDPGSLLGLISVTTGAPTLTTAVAATNVELLVLGREELDGLPDIDPEIKPLLDRLVIRNLAERYRRLVRSNLEIHRLANALDHEREQLAETIAHLETTRLALISREKLATLGQLVAGVAHELNNPAAALQHALGSLRVALSGILATAREGWDAIFEEGLARPVGESIAQRERINRLADRFPALPRPTLRRLARCPDSVVDAVPAGLLSSGGDDAELDVVLDVFEAGNAVRGIGVAGDRIVRLVRSLKNHSRDGSDAVESTDLADSLRDTLMVLAKPLRHIEVEMRLGGLPAVRCRPGAMSQVWTNLIANAAEAMGGHGKMRLSGAVEGGCIVIRVEDSGPGVSEADAPRIFEMNFTTKSGGARFGLGLGLSISREIVEGHGGRISLGRAAPDLGGAAFEVVLPAG